MELKHNPYRYRRSLPHIQDSVPLFVRFGTAARWILPAQARDIVMETCLYEHRRRCYLWAAVVMPEHVHLLLSLQYSADREPIALYRILGDIKGVSAHRINKTLDRKGRVWQEESFDRATRDGEFEYYIDYIINNPVKRGLVAAPDEYKWLWYE